MNSPRQEVAKEYIRYRNKRNIARKAKSNEIFEEIINAMGAYNEALMNAGVLAGGIA